jgi:hypothetical protein
MSRTFRRRRHRYEYQWALRVWNPAAPSWSWLMLDRYSPEGRRAIARFHSDAYVSMRSPAPGWYRRQFDHQQRTRNDRELRRWLADPGYDPVTQVRHLHRANRSWW